LFFNNLVIRHIESSVSQLSLFSLFSTISSLWTQFWVSVDTTWTPRWTPKPSPQRQDQVYQKRPFWCPRFPVIEQKFRSLFDSQMQQAIWRATMVNPQMGSRHESNLAAGSVNMDWTPYALQFPNCRDSPPEPFHRQIDIPR